VKEKWKIILPIALMGVLAVSMWPGMSIPIARFFHLPHGQNLSPAYAIAFCAGIYFPKRLRWWMPLTMFAILDMALNHHYGVDLVNRYLFLNLGAYALLIWLGTRYSVRNTWFKQVRGGILGAIIFYLVTNTASWLWDPAYAKTLLGWLQALTIGAPGFPPTIQFFFNSLLSGGLFTGLFAGAMKLAGAKEVDESEQEQPESEPEKADAPDAPIPAPEESKA